jgi:hypothetical protein
VGGFTYEWNAQQTDATLRPGRARRDIGNGQTWRFPSERSAWIATRARRTALGLRPRSSIATLAYTQTDRTANELITLSHIGVLSPPITSFSDAACNARSGRHDRNR